MGNRKSKFRKSYCEISVMVIKFKNLRTVRHSIFRKLLVFEFTFLADTKKYYLYKIC